MKVAVVKETGPAERRVALVPEAVAKLQVGGHEVLVQTGAGAGAFFPDDAYSEAGASVVTADQLAGADAVLMVGRPDAAQLARLRPGPGGVRHVRAARRPRAGREPRDGRRDGGQPRPDPADAVAGPADGRPDVSGQHRRLQGRGAGGRHVRQVLSAADHGRRHGAARQGARTRHRRRRPAGHRDRPPARSSGQRL